MAFNAFTNVFRIAELRTRLAYTLALLAVYRLGVFSNMFAFIHYTTPALLIFGAAFTGVCYGTIFTLFPAATADFYGIRNLGVNYGLVFTAFGVAGVIGPILGGKIRDSFGAYTHSYTISAIMLLLGALLALIVRAPKAEPVPLPSGGPIGGQKNVGQAEAIRK